MKVITIQELQANLDHFGQICRQERVVITVNGQPQLELSPYDQDDDDFMSDLIEQSADFRRMMEARRNDRFLTAEEVLQRLDDD